ncbi:MAG: type II secretion system F family protein [Acidothermus cellulolyticus]|nr:type II secretion system F family protein [Acidothermus cellulolyticus]
MTLTSGAAVGLCAGVGTALAVSGVPHFRHPRLADRLAPYLRDRSRPSQPPVHTAARGTWPVVGQLLAPVLADIARRVDRVMGGPGSVRRRLDAAGRGMAVEEFRVEQVLWGSIGFLVGLGVSLLLLAQNPHRPPLALGMLCVIAACCGAIARDVTLSREAQRRSRRMLAEFPTVAELLALAVGAGESPAAALERVVRVCRGELSVEFARALSEARTGGSLVTALENLAARNPLDIMSRFVDGMIVAMQRGTPLADVLRAQASDVREAAKRSLLDIGGRKEIGMMVPVVFLILPITLLFALFPSFVSLHLLI